MADYRMQTQQPRHKPGRPRRPIDAAYARRLRNEGKTLDQIATALACGRGTVARALELAPVAPEPPVGPSRPVTERARELARSRAERTPVDAEERRRRRENARHLVHRRWGDAMKVGGQPFKPAEANGNGQGWIGAALIAGGLLLWALGCPVPL